MENNITLSDIINQFLKSNLKSKRVEFNNSLGILFSLNFEIRINIDGNDNIERIDIIRTDNDTKYNILNCSPKYVLKFLQ